MPSISVNTTPLHAPAPAPNKPLRIRELGAIVGVESETIRYYEKIGLLPPPARSANGYRAYAKHHIERLAFIRHCRSLDMSLPDIQRLLQLMANPQADGVDVDELVDQQLKKVRSRLISLQALEKQLLTLQSRCNVHEHGAHLASECPVLHELVIAAQGESCACHSEQGR